MAGLHKGFSDEQKINKIDAECPYAQGSLREGALGLVRTSGWIFIVIISLAVRRRIFGQARSHI